MRIRAFNAAMILVCAGTASAGPLQPQRVMPDSTWVVHLDIEALAGSNFIRSMMDGPLGAEIRADIEQDFIQEIGIDPFRDLRSVTIFGASAENEDATVLVSATPAVDAPLGRLPELVENYSEIREGTRVVHSWDDDDAGGRMYAYTAPGSGPNERIVLFSGNIDSLRSGIIRLEAGGADVAPVLQDRLPSAGSVFFFTADEMPDIGGEDGDASAMLRYAQAITIDAGEQGDQLHWDARVTTASPEDANTMLQVVQGMLALGRMAASSEPGLQPMLRIADGCRGSVEGSTLNLSLRIDSSAMTRALEEIDAAEERDEAEHADDEEAIREDLKKLEKLRDVKPKGGKQPE